MSILTPRGRLMTNREYTNRYGEAWVFDVAEAFSAFSRNIGVHPVSLAVAWAAAHPAVTCPIIGARDLAQLEPALKSLEIQMTGELRVEISALSRTPPPAMDRLEEQHAEG